MEEVRKRWKIGAGELRDRDKRLAPLIRKVGDPEPRLNGEPYLALARAVLSQQLAPRAAQAIWERFAAGGGAEPRWVASAAPETLRSFGVSLRKAQCLSALGAAFAQKGFRRELLTAPREQVILRLVELPGIGEWTAHMFLIFCRGETDVLPTGDYGVRRGLQKLRRLDQIPLPKQVAGLVPQWKGWESVGSWYLWKALDRGFL